MKKIKDEKMAILLFNNGRKASFFEKLSVSLIKLLPGISIFSDIEEIIEHLKKNECRLLIYYVGKVEIEMEKIKRIRPKIKVLGVFEDCFESAYFKEQGFDDFLARPLNLATLKSKVNKFLRK